MECSEDRFHGGRIMASQPLQGFRSGTDAVILAAAVLARTGDDLLEIGSGVGVASLCLAARVPDCRITGVEIAPELVALANENARANGFAERVRFEEGDIFNLRNIVRRTFDHVFCNPPFHGKAGEISPNEDRTRALFDRDGLHGWIVAALARVSAGGTLTLIVRADRLGETLAALPQHGGAIFPLWPRQHEPATRTILQVRQNSRAPLVLLSGLVMHDDSGRYTQEADAVLRGGASLALASPRR